MNICSKMRVSQLSVGGVKYAAKKLVNVGEGRGDAIDIKTQVDILTCDLIRLKRLEALAKLFIKLAEGRLVRICRKFSIIISSTSALKT